MKTESILQVLRRRGLKTTPTQERRIRETTHIAQLDQWLDSAITATSAADLFA